MPKGRNKVFLQGNMGADPELRYTGAGTAVANVRLATPSVRKDGDEYVETTEWHNVTFWGKLAEIVNEYTSKGSRIDVEGELRTRQWEDRDGNARYTTEVHVKELILLGGKGDGNGGGGSADNDDDLPFD